MNAMRGCRPYQIVAKAPGCIKGDECRTACRRNVRFCLEPEDTGRELLWPLDGQNLQPAQEVIDWLEQTVAGMLIPHPLSGEAKATPVGSAHDFDDSLSRDCSCARLLKCGVTH